ncbi:hypothetical protein M426DRAFT_11943 [Hypoxylon sp. CI-4A]|nr:hypothetical protein M426DRAFT_11943 [Hypoxylon sp. CI-4A]
MPQTNIQTNQVSDQKSRKTSEMMKYYLASQPSTASDRLVQGNIASDQDMADSLKRKQLQLDILAGLVKGGSSQST